MGRKKKSEEVKVVEAQLEAMGEKMPDVEAMPARALLTCAKIVSGETVVDAIHAGGACEGTKEVGLYQAGVTPYKPRSPLARALQALGVTPEFLAQRIKEGCEASKPVLGRDAAGVPVIVGETPDHKARFPYIELSARARGDLGEALEDGADSYELRVLQIRRRMQAGG